MLRVALLLLLFLLRWPFPIPQAAVLCVVGQCGGRR